MGYIPIEIYPNLNYFFIIMNQPYKDRVIKEDPWFTCFKPSWVSRECLEKNVLKIDEFEALRLTNLEWKSNIEWAKSMNISSSTFNRILKSAYFKVTDSLVNWKWIKIINKKNTSDCD